MPTPIDDFLEKIRNWGSSERDKSAVILVGSYARGEAKPDSDIDLVIIAGSPEKYFSEQSWLENFGHPVKTEYEDWGLVQSLRVWYGSGFEVEFGFTSEDWMTEPLEEGTRKVLENGYLFIINKINYSPSA